MTDAARPSGTRYAVVTPARDEGAFLADLVRDMERQSLPPVRWVIVDDGSTDPTASILREATSRVSWIVHVALPSGRPRLPGPGVVRAFEAGLEYIDLEAVDFIAKLDADLRIPPDYFARILSGFLERPHLGIAGGACVEYGKVVGTKPSYHVRGATKIYRIACFRDIGGLRPVLPWDGVDITAAIARGWETQTLVDVRFEHRRPAGSHPDSGGLVRARVREGRGNYIRGSYLLAVLGRSAKILARRPVVIGAFALLWGYLSELFAGGERVADRDAIRMQRKLDLLRFKGEVDVRALASRERRRLDPVARQRP